MDVGNGLELRLERKRNSEGTEQKPVFKYKKWEESDRNWESVEGTELMRRL